MVYLTRPKQGLVVKCREKRDKGCLVTRGNIWKKYAFLNQLAAGCSRWNWPQRDVWCYTKKPPCDCSGRLLQLPVVGVFYGNRQLVCRHLPTAHWATFKIKGPPSDPCWLQHWGTAFTLKVSNFHSVSSVQIIGDTGNLVATKACTRACWSCQTVSRPVLLEPY